MQDANAIIRQPIFIGLFLSIAIHGAMLQNRSIWTPPVPHMETGKTAIQLTLLPSRSGDTTTAAAKPTAIPPDAALTPEPAQSIASSTQPAAAKTAAAPGEADQRKGITSPAVAKSAFHPAYPRISRQRGEEGTVALLVQVLPDGTAGSIETVRSSGFRRLDHAAAKAAEITAYDPAMIFGQPVESVIELSYTYRLTHD